MSSDERLHTFGRVRLVYNHQQPVSIHGYGAETSLCVTHQAEHGFVKVVVLLLQTDTHTHTRTCRFTKVMMPLILGFQLCCTSTTFDIVSIFLRYKSFNSNFADYMLEKNRNSKNAVMCLLRFTI